MPDSILRAIVVGADNRVGAAICERFAADSALVGRIAGAAAGDDAAAAAQSWTEVLEREIDQLGGVEVVVNARHYVARGAIGDVDAAAFGAAFRRNASVNWAIQKAAILALRRVRGGSRGVLINVLPALARIAAPGCAAVCAAARGLLMSTRSAALECARERDGLIVSAVLVGRIDGDAAHWPDAALLPRAPSVEPAEVASAVRFLATDGAAYMTGVELPVDSGLLAS